jgi:hypothetical protein
MRSGELRDRVAALERYVEADAERWRQVHERVDAMRGMLLGVVVALRKAHPEVHDTVVAALRRFESEAKKLNALDAAVADAREFIDMMEADRR